MYWGLQDYEKQLLWLNNNIVIQDCQRTLKAGSRRSRTLLYSFEAKQVCKKFFVGTLNLTDSAIESFVKKAATGDFKDKRGMHGKQRKLDENLIVSIKSHIESFPSVESHYTRAKSSRLYLPSNLNIAKMYHLFKEMNPELNCKESQYRKVFCTNYNFSFHVPKKDACITCAKYYNSSPEDRCEESYQAHLKNKDKAREQKLLDKMNAKSDPTLKVFTYDLQSVLNTPCSNVSALYYSRKFATYNNTFYDLATGDGYCFLWHETEGERGADEIGTTILKLIHCLEGPVRRVVFYCDCCGGQNRNKYIASLLIFIINTIDLDTVSIKFLESGHTQMEADSMHSTIERAKKNISIYSPEEWHTILRIARRDNPYWVEDLTYSDMYDLKGWFIKLSHTFKRNSNNQNVNWLKIKCLEVRNTDKLKIYYKEGWNEDFNVIDLLDGRRRKRESEFEFKLANKFKQRLNIAPNKLKDLKNLCDTNVIPRKFHPFYLNLTSGNKRNCLDEPDQEEDEELE